MGHIDLTELSKRESERVEWKENVADIDDIIKTAVAFANGLFKFRWWFILFVVLKKRRMSHGFQKLIQTGLTSDRLKEIGG